MVRVVPLGPGPRELCPPSSLEILNGCPDRFHSDPSHESFAWLAEAGLGCSAIPQDGIPDGAVLAIPSGGAGSLAQLVAVIDRLLGPGGCPWDQEQTHESLKRHLLEEAYEVLDAIDSGDPDRFAEELGDLLMQPIMHAQMSKLAGGFDTDEVAKRIVGKLIRRHPHVFGDADAASADEVLKNWDRIKQEEKGTGRESILAGVPGGMASLLRAFEISKRAARAGFEWPDREAVFAKLDEEVAELAEALAEADSQARARRVEAEIGDMLFTAVNIARWCGVEPEEALRKMLNRFSARFMAMEAAAGRNLQELSPEEWDELWEASKRMERVGEA